MWKFGSDDFLSAEVPLAADVLPGTSTLPLRSTGAGDH